MVTSRSIARAGRRNLRNPARGAAVISAGRRDRLPDDAPVAVLGEVTAEAVVLLAAEVPPGETIDVRFDGRRG